MPVFLKKILKVFGRHKVLEQSRGDKRCDRNATAASGKRVGGWLGVRDRHWRGRHNDRQRSSRCIRRWRTSILLLNGRIVRRLVGGSIVKSDLRLICAQ